MKKKINIKIPNSMKNFYSNVAKITYNGFNNIKRFIFVNANYCFNFVDMFFPCAMYFMGANTKFNSFIYAIAILFFILKFYIKNFLDSLGIGSNIPAPKKRFTEYNNGEVSVDRNRIDEMILYMNELENYLETRGILK